MTLLVISQANTTAEYFSSDVPVHYVSPYTVHIRSKSKVEVHFQDELLDISGVYVHLPDTSPTFVRVLLESLRDTYSISQSPEVFHLLGDKIQFFRNLSEAGVPFPRTTFLSVKKSVSNTSFPFPVIGRREHIGSRTEPVFVNTEDHLGGFLSSLTYGEDLVSLQECASGEVYDCLYLFGEVSSLQLQGEGPLISLRSEGTRCVYRTTPTPIRENVVRAAEHFGAKICSFRVVGDRIVSVDPFPDLPFLTGKSGQHYAPRIVQQMGVGD